jgi:hypothetical protein
LHQELPRPHRLVGALVPLVVGRDVHASSQSSPPRTRAKQSTSDAWPRTQRLHLGAGELDPALRGSRPACSRAAPCGCSRRSCRRNGCWCAPRGAGYTSR